MKTKEQIEQEWVSHLNSNKKAKRQSCIEWLDFHELPWQSSNGGVHIRVLCFERSVDIWPTTGRISVGCDPSEASSRRVIEVLNGLLSQLKK